MNVIPIQRQFKAFTRPPRKLKVRHQQLREAADTYSDKYNLKPDHRSLLRRYAETYIDGDQSILECSSLIGEKAVRLVRTNMSFYEGWTPEQCKKHLSFSLNGDHAGALCWELGQILDGKLDHVPTEDHIHALIHDYFPHLKVEIKVDRDYRIAEDF
jgi:hypothetical protein